MEQPHFACGTVEKFSAFIASLKKRTNVIALSHTDVDGLASAKVVAAALKVDNVYLVDYDEVTDALVEKLKQEAPSHIVITDIGVKKEFVEKLGAFARVLVIDHHQVSEDLNAGSVTFLNAQGMCATYLAWWLFKKVKDLSSWKWLVACACIADVMTDEVRAFMIAQFKKEGLDFDAGVKQGRFWELVTGVNNALIYYADDRMQVYRAVTSTFMMPVQLIEPARLVETDIQNTLLRFEKEKEIIKGRFFWEFKATYKIKSFISTILSFRYPTTTMIVLKREGDFYFVSGRCQDRHEDMNMLLKTLVQGFPNADAGGHIPAAGGHFPVDKLGEFKKRLEFL